jgi:regulator of chromosome condensation
VVSLVSGENSTLALTNKGEVFHWGDIRMGRREVSRLKKEVLKPARVTFPRKKGGVHIEKIYSGTNHFFALSKEGDVYAWGLNNYGQLGLGDLKNRLKPELVPLLAGIGVVELAGGTHHSLALTKEGEVLSFGRGDYGQLGIGTTQEHSTPQRIPIESFEGLKSSDDRLIHISSGQSHSLAWTAKGGGYAWGFGASLQLTNGEEDDEKKPYRMSGQQLDGKQIVQLGGGAQHTVVLVRGLPPATPAAFPSSSSAPASNGPAASSLTSK